MRDAQLATTVAMALAIGWTMFFAGFKKNALELKQRRRICPSCGRRIDGTTCKAH